MDSVEAHMTRLDPATIYTFDELYGGLFGPTGQAYRVGTVGELDAALAAPVILRVKNETTSVSVDVSLTPGALYQKQGIGQPIPFNRWDDLSVQVVNPAVPTGSGYGVTIR